MLIALLVAGHAFANDPASVCPTVGNAHLEMGIKVLSERYNIPRADAQAILSDPKYSAKAWNAVEYNQWVTEHAGTNAGKIFFAALAKRLASPEYSSADPARQSQLRWAAVQHCLAEAGLSAPSNVASLLWGVAETYPTVLPPTPITPDVLAVRRREFFEGLSTDAWIGVYRGYYKFHNGKYKPSPLAAPKALPNPGQVRRFLIVTSQTSTELGLKQRLEHHLVSALGNYVVGRRVGEIDTWLGKEFSDYCAKNDITGAEEKVLREYLRYLFHQAAPVVYHPSNMPREWTDSVHGAVADLRRRWAHDERERQRIAEMNRPAPLPPPIVPLVLRPEPAPRPSRRPRPVENRDEAPAPRPVAPLAFKPLTPEQESALFVRLSPSDTHYSKFTKALDRLERKLNDDNYKKLYGKIVETLWLLEQGVDPAQITHLGRTNQNGIWDLKPLGSAFTIRFFIGKSGRHVRILALEDDVKSGGESERRLIIDLRDEWKNIEQALPK